jgi:hypothetical protein
MDPATLMRFVELCKRKLLSNDTQTGNETDSHNQGVTCLRP